MKQIYSSLPQSPSPAGYQVHGYHILTLCTFHTGIARYLVVFLVLSSFLFFLLSKAPLIRSIIMSSFCSSLIPIMSHSQAHGYCSESALRHAPKKPHTHNVATWHHHLFTPIACFFPVFETLAALMPFDNVLQFQNTKQFRLFWVIGVYQNQKKVYHIPAI